MRPYIAAELAPGAAKATDSEIDAYVRATAITVHHPLGTCKMGTDHDEAAVVGVDLKVRGVLGLRVVDASVMPDLADREHQCRRGDDCREGGRFDPRPDAANAGAGVNWLNAPAVRLS